MEILENTQPLQVSEKGNSQLDVWVLTDLLQELPLAVLLLWFISKSTELPMFHVHLKTFTL